MDMKNFIANTEIKKPLRMKIEMGLHLSSTCTCIKETAFECLGHNWIFTYMKFLCLMMMKKNFSLL